MKIFTAGRSRAIKEKNRELRMQLWPNIGDHQLWIRQQRSGFTTIPRALTLITSILNDLSKNKPLSSIYLELWCRANDEGFVIIKHDEMAFHAGFTGERAIRTWKDRLRTLERLGFVKLATGPSGPESYALIRNPYHAVAELRQNQTPGLTDASWNALRARMIDIGAKDLDAPESAAPAAQLGSPLAT